jgi:hypothetical protein
MGRPHRFEAYAGGRDAHTNLAEQIMIILIVVIIKGD